MMHPKDFMEHWQVSRAELAQILSKSVTTVDHWLSSGKSRLEPPPDVTRRLDELHTRFLQWQLEDQNIPQVRQLYELIRDRAPLPAALQDRLDTES